MSDPSGEIQVAVLGLLADHPRTVKSIYAALEHDYPGRFGFNDVLVCLRFLEQHNRVKSDYKESDYYFVKASIAKLE